MRALLWSLLKINMSVLELKANTIQVQEMAEGYVADNGDYIIGTTKWSRTYKCDAVPAGTAKEISLGDGYSRKYAFTCYLNPKCRDFQIGQKVKVTRYGMTYDLEVIDFKRYQHQAKVWVG